MTSSWYAFRARLDCARAPCGALVKSAIAEDALPEPSSSTCDRFLQEDGHSYNGIAQLFVDSQEVTPEGGTRVPHNHEHIPARVPCETSKSLDF